MRLCTLSRQACSTPDVCRGGRRRRPRAASARRGAGPKRRRSAARARRRSARGCRPRSAGAMSAWGPSTRWASCYTISGWRPATWCAPGPVAWACGRGAYAPLLHAMVRAWSLGRRVSKATTPGSASEGTLSVKLAFSLALHIECLWASWIARQSSAVPTVHSPRHSVLQRLGAGRPPRARRSGPRRPPKARPRRRAAATATATLPQARPPRSTARRARSQGRRRRARASRARGPGCWAGRAPRPPRMRARRPWQSGARAAALLVPQGAPSRPARWLARWLARPGPSAAACADGSVAGCRARGCRLCAPLDRTSAAHIKAAARGALRTYL